MVEVSKKFVLDKLKVGWIVANPTNEIVQVYGLVNPEVFDEDYEFDDDSDESPPIGISQAKYQILCKEPGLMESVLLIPQAGIGKFLHSVKNQFATKQAVQIQYLYRNGEVEICTQDEDLSDW